MRQVGTRLELVDETGRIETRVVQREASEPRPHWPDFRLDVGGHCVQEEFVLHGAEFFQIREARECFAKDGAQLVHVIFGIEVAEWQVYYEPGEGPANGREELTHTAGDVWAVEIRWWEWGEEEAIGRRGGEVD